MKWKRNPSLDSAEYDAPWGKYVLTRTYYDSSKLYLDNVLLNTNSTGSHMRNKKFAEIHNNNMKFIDLTIEQVLSKTLHEFNHFQELLDIPRKTVTYHDSRTFTTLEKTIYKGRFKYDKAWHIS